MRTRAIMASPIGTKRGKQTGIVPALNQNLGRLAGACYSALRLRD